jgi:hypothetical protein
VPLHRIDPVLEIQQVIDGVLGIRIVDGGIDIVFEMVVVYALLKYFVGGAADHGCKLICRFEDLEIWKFENSDLKMQI